MLGGHLEREVEQVHQGGCRDRDPSWQDEGDDRRCRQPRPRPRRRVRTME